ncbi:nicotinate phosphoribosyltransferase [Desulfobacter vibrioformis]|uniref:nicotinate phosphoribosyltransferase n=1 Tax=Desulfobacter vibrioformis TaxID=34031 RepID=UPI0005576712|nr:nicotinate phosphoribosyltransferase [Desulfobacter vibrioformis]
MIETILDNDLYKFTMQQAVCRLYPKARVRYELTNRSHTPFPAGFDVLIKNRVARMAGLGLTRDERGWLEKACPYFTKPYLDYLSSYRYDPDQVEISQQGHTLSVRVAGPWSRTILWEVPLMAVISETYFKVTAPDILSRQAIRERNQTKVKLMSDAGLTFVEFGTRRRFSSANHAHFLEDVLDLDHHGLAGTSNVHFARIYGLVPVGTLAHEWIMFHSALTDYARANAAAMDAWLKVYPDVLGIALTDTFTTKIFLKAFTRDRAGRFSGVRHDSGDPEIFTRNMISHYRKKGIDPAAKAIVFSDGLDVERAINIHKVCRGQVKDSYGIGTNLTNDVGVDPLNIVIKLSWVEPEPGMEGRPTVKLSDDPGKHTGDPEELLYCRKALGL